MGAELWRGEQRRRAGVFFTEKDAYVAITGHTYDNFGEYLLDVNVNWYCDDHDPPVWLGGTAVDAAAYYEIHAEDPWTGHNGHTLHGVATKAGYYDDHQYIYDFRWAGIPYERDFYLTPQGN